MELLLEYLGLVGSLAFALSGALAAVRKEMDLFGICVIALMPAIGGGTIRDLILGVPIFWVVDSTIIWIALGAAALAFFMASRIESRRKVLNWMDAIGLAIFAVLGAAKALEVTGSGLIAIMMGVTTGVAGGIIRDVICNEVPLVLKVEENIYATAAFIGAGTYYLLTFTSLEPAISIWIGIAVTFVARAGGILLGWRLPKARKFGG